MKDYQTEGNSPVRLTEPASRRVIRILMVVQNAKGMKTTVNFLKRRGWQIAVVESMREAIPKTLEGKPNAVLLSWNLKNTNILQAYSLLSDQFKTLCVLFAEDNSQKTELALMNAGVPHILLPPNSGPRIFTRLQTIMRSEEKKTPGAREDGRCGGTSGKITELSGTAVPTFGGAIPAEGRWIPLDEGSSDSHAKKTFKFVPKDRKRTESVYYFQGVSSPRYNENSRTWESGNEHDVFYQDRLKGREYSIQQSHPEKKPHNASDQPTPEVGAAQELPSPTHSEPKKAKKKRYEHGEETEAPFKKSKVRKTAVFEVAKEDGNEDGETDRGSLAQVIELMPPKSGKSTKGYGIAEGESNKSEPDLHGVMRRSPEKGLQDLSQGSQAPPTRTSDTDDANRETKMYGHLKKAQTILEKCLEEAVRERASHSETSEYLVRIGAATEYSVGIIETSRFKGYIVTTGPSSSDKVWGLFKPVWEDLKIKMQAAGEPLEEEVFPLIFKLDALEFLKWAEQHAEFLTVTHHLNHEIGFAYLPARDTRVFFEDPSAEMWRVPLENIREDVDLTFNLFLYMPKNQKYILYFKPGHRMRASTIERLRGYGVQNVYVKRAEEQAFLAYTAACHIQKTVNGKKGKKE